MNSKPSKDNSSSQRFYEYNELSQIKQVYSSSLAFIVSNSVGLFTAECKEVTVLLFP